MQRRDVPMVLFGAAIASAAVPRRAVAQSCNLPCYPQTTAEVTAGVTPSDGSFVPGNVRRYGAVGDGNANDTAAIQAAIDVAAAMPGGGLVTIPAGEYKCVTGLVMSSDRIHLRGDGIFASRLTFAPTASGTLLTVNGSASMRFQFSVEDLALYSNDSTHNKIALDLVDCGHSLVRNVFIGGGVQVGGTFYWSGSNSIGIRCRGREFCKFDNVWSTADRPLLIAKNPHIGIDIDHFHFHDTYLLANGNPCVEIANGVNLTQVVFDGSQPWVLGTHGLYWIDTTSSIVSNGLTIENVRVEQGTNAAAYIVRIEHNTALQNLTVRAVTGGVDRNGFYLRGCDDVKFDQVSYTGGAGRTALDVDATVRRVRATSCFWQAGCASVLGGQRLLRGSPHNPNTAGLRPDFLLDEESNADRSYRMNASLAGTPFNLVNLAVAELAPAGSIGIAAISDSEGAGAFYLLRGNLNTAVEISDPVGIYSSVAGTGSRFNIYWSAANNRYEIENRRGAARNVQVMMLGSFNLI